MHGGVALHLIGIGALLGGGVEGGRLYGAREAVEAGLDDHHRVEAQQAQVREVVLGQALPAEVRVQQADPPEATLARPVPVEVGDEEAVCISHDDVGHASAPIHHDAQLPVQLP